MHYLASAADATDEEACPYLRSGDPCAAAVAWLDYVGDLPSAPGGEITVPVTSRGDADAQSPSTVRVRVRLTATVEPPPGACPRCGAAYGHGSDNPTCEATMFFDRPAAPAIDPALLAELDRREAEMAKLRACENSQNEDACGECLACKDVSFSDVWKQRNRLRAERDNLDRELRATTKQGIDALGAAIAERDALRERVDRLEGELEMAERNAGAHEAIAEGRAQIIDAATARGDRLAALLREAQRYMPANTYRPLSEAAHGPPLVVRIDAALADMDVHQQREAWERLKLEAKLVGLS